MSLRTLPLLLLALTCCGLAPSALAQKAYTFTPRLGPVIDAEERAYFGLFPEVDGFAEARATAQGDEVTVTITTSAADSVLTMPHATAGALGRFVETFESSETAFYNPHWQPVRPYVRPDVPTANLPDEGDVVLYVEGGQYAGHPVYVGDSLIVIDRSPEFDWRAFELPEVVVPVSEVELARVYSGFWGSRRAPLVGIPAGLLINELALSLRPGSRSEDGQLERRITAATLGAVAVNLFRLGLSNRVPYARAADDVTAEAWFTPENRPPEFASDAELRRRATQRPDPFPLWRSQLGWFDTGIGTVLSPPTSTYPFFNNFEGGETEREVEFASGPALESAIAARPNAWLSLGFGVYAAPTPSEDADALQEVAYSKPRLRAFAEIDLIRLIDGDSPIGLAFGSGLLYAQSVVTQRFPENTATTYNPSGYDIRSSGITPLLSATFEAGILPETSLFVRALGWASPDVDVPKTEVQSVSFPGTVVFRVEPHTVEFGQIGIVAGIRTGL